MKIKYTKITEDSYEVYIDGHYIGEVYKWWSNPGGWGWMCEGGNVLSFPTRIEATRMLLKLKRSK